MKKLGIAIKKGELWFSVLDGTQKENANITLADKKHFQPEEAITKLMFGTIFFWSMLS